MGTVYYLVVKDTELKNALVVDIGKHYSEYASREDVEQIDTALLTLEDILESDAIIEFEGTEVAKLRVEHICTLATLIRQLNNILTTEIDHSGSLTRVLKVYGLIKGLESWRPETIEWKIVSEYSIEEEVKKLKEDGYRVVEWMMEED